MIRTDARGEYNSENTFLGKKKFFKIFIKTINVLVVRIQFYAIEIARNREGFNDTIRHLYGSKKL